MNDRERQTCGDCGAFEGEYHENICDMEQCPVCGYQLLFCDCTEEEVIKAGRYRFILYPHVCAKCGELWPTFFMVSRQEWERFIEPSARREILCMDCYDFIRQVSTTQEEYTDVEPLRPLDWGGDWAQGGD